MKDIIRIVNTISKVVEEFMPHSPKCVISKSLICFSIWKEHINTKLQKELIGELEKALILEDKNVYDNYDYHVTEHDSFIIVVACLI